MLHLHLYPDTIKGDLPRTVSTHLQPVSTILSNFILDIGRKVPELEGDRTNRKFVRH